MMSTKTESLLNQQFQEEGALLKAAMEWLQPQERNGIKVLRICDRYTKGYSDLFLCVKGIFVVIELKDDTGKPSKQQLLFIQKMNEAGAIGGVCRTVGEISSYINKALELARKLEG